MVCRETVGMCRYVTCVFSLPRKPPFSSCSSNEQDVETSDGFVQAMLTRPDKCCWHENTGMVRDIHKHWAIVNFSWENLWATMTRWSPSNWIQTCRQAVLSDTHSNLVLLWFAIAVRVICFSFAIVAGVLSNLLVLVFMPVVGKQTVQKIPRPSSSFLLLLQLLIFWPVALGLWFACLDVVVWFLYLPYVEVAESPKWEVDLQAHRRTGHSSEKTLQPGKFFLLKVAFNDHDLCDMDEFLSGIG